jgi:HAE1 family hydrophobic/amphiphilic exporter-1
MGIPPAKENIIGPAIAAVCGYEAKTRTDWRVTPDGNPDGQDVADALNFRLNQAERYSRADRAMSRVAAVSRPIASAGAPRGTNSPCQPVTSNPAMPELCAKVGASFPAQRFLCLDGMLRGNPQVYTVLYNQTEQGYVTGYCLAASLIVALTVAPAASSTLLKNSKPKELKWFDKVQEKYVKSLEWCFQHRWAPLGAAVVLLVFCGWRVMSMGVEMLPTITSNEAIVTLSTEKDMTKEESYAVAENVIDALLAVDNVEEVGVTTDSRVAGMDVGQLGLPQTITDLLNAANSYGTYQINVMLDESLSSRQIEQAREALEEAVNGVENCTATVEISGMQELTSQLDMGLTVQVSGNDIDTMTALSEKVVDMVNEMDGFTNATNGLGSGDATINLQIDRDKVRSYGLTVAQVYQQIAAKLTTTTTAQTPVAIDGSTMNVQISNNLDPMTKENMMDMTFTTSVMAADGTTETGTCTLGDMATWVTGSAPDSITSKNQTRYISVTADAVEGTNTTTETRALEKKLNEFAASDEMPEGCSFYMGGGSEINGMVVDQMGQWMFLALPFVYLVMVAQFQSLLSPFIVLFTIPLAFTGGLLGLLLTGQQLTMISLMGFIVLMGTVVNNGIVFVDYANQLRLGGMKRRAALIATGKTRMRPILMTTLTTVLAMLQLVFSNDMASQLMSGMAIVIICGLSYATLMTLYIVPILYDILFKKPPLVVDVGDDGMDDIPDDAAEYIAQSNAAEAQPEA